MDEIDIGVKFGSFQDLKHSLTKYFLDTNTLFWKKDSRTIGAARGITRSINEALVYYEVKFICINGGTKKGKTSKASKKMGCPAYFRFKATEDGQCLQLVAMNIKHNHELKLTDKQITLLKEENHEVFSESGDEAAEDIEYIQVVMDKEDDQSLEKDTSSSSSSSQIEPIKFTFTGVIAPVFTPYYNDCQCTINEEIIPKYVKYLWDHGIRGILVNGTSGEGMSLNSDERKKLAELWLKAAKPLGMHVMVQIGGCCYPDVIGLAKHAEEHGADSLLCLPELYSRPKTLFDLYFYLSVVSSAATKTPMLYYHIPSCTNVNLHMGEFLKKCAPQLPTFVGIKFTSPNLEEGAEALNAHGGKYKVFLGCDSLLLAAAAIGFDCAIATTLNMFPKLGIEIFRSYQNGDVLASFKHQENLSKLVQNIIKHGDWVPTMKETMNLVTPINVGPVRKPLIEITRDVSDLMQSDLTTILSEIKDSLS